MRYRPRVQRWTVGDRYLRAALAAAMGLFVARAIVANAVIPPWQGPDEPAHFALVRQLTRAGQDVAGTEQAVLASMARHGWWHYYQQSTPDPIPESFSEVPEHLTSGTLDQPAYYVLGAAILKAADVSDLERQYRVLRWLSVGLSIAALLCGWAGTRALFGEWAAIGALSIAALHPQFLLTAISVNPDALITFCGAFMWWQAARALGKTGWRRAGPVALIIAAAIIAVLSKRNGIPLAVIAVVLLGFALFERRKAHVIAASIGIAALMAAFVPLGYLAMGDFAGFRRLTTFWVAGLTIRRELPELSVEHVREYLLTAIDMSWLFGGWLRFPAPQPWLWVARVLTIGTFTAGLVLLVKTGRHNRALVLSFLFVAIHAGSLLWIAFWGRSAPQGRYFFAVLFPAVAILWAAVLHWIPPPRRGAVGVALVGIVACLDAAGFLLVLIPAYVG